jgi:hypothetical protein
VLDPSVPPIALDLPSDVDVECKRMLEFSTDPGFAGRPVRVRVAKGVTSLAAPSRQWLRVLRLGADGTTVHARVVCPLHDTMGSLNDMVVLAADAPEIMGPASGATIDSRSAPEFSFDAGAAPRAWLEFSATSDFGTVAGRVALRHNPQRVGREVWRQIQAKLAKAGSAGGGSFRVISRDVLGRVAESEVRSFVLSGN